MPNATEGGHGAHQDRRGHTTDERDALDEAKELIVALDWVEIDQLAPQGEVLAAQDLADRVAAMLMDHPRPECGRAPRAAQLLTGRQGKGVFRSQHVSAKATPAKAASRP